MAVVTKLVAYSGSLTGSSVDTVTLTNAASRWMIVNTGTVPIYCRADGIAATVAGDNCFCVPGGQVFVMNLSANPTLVSGAPIGGTMSITASAACTYTVQIQTNS